NQNCAYEFPGTSSDYIEIPYSEDFNIPIEGSFSISLWYKGASSAGGDLEFFLVKENPSATPVGTDYHLGLYDCNNPSFGSRYSPIAFASTNECGASIDPSWHHVVAIYNNREWHLYVDNILEDVNVDSAEGIFQSTNGIKLGKKFQGRLDDVRFYSKV